MTVVADKSRHTGKGRCPGRRWVPAFAGTTKSIDPVRRRLAGRFSITEG